MTTDTRCPICSSKSVTIYKRTTDVEYFTSEKLYEYYECSSCNTIFLKEPPVNELGLIYPSNYYSFKEIKKDLVIQFKEFLDKRLFKKILGSIPNKNINLLDVGGGSGWLLDVIKSIEPRVQYTQVVDIDSEAKDIAEKNGHHFFLGRVEDFVSDKKFDLILLLNLIEHVENPLQILQNLEKVLNPGGCILIKTPNIESVDAVWFKSSYWGGLHAPRHFILFSKNSFLHILKQTNLELDTLKYTQGAPFWAWSVIIWLCNKGILSASSERPVINHPLYPLFAAFFAAFDILRSPFSKGSQMFILLRKK